MCHGLKTRNPRFFLFAAREAGAELWWVEAGRRVKAVPQKKKS